MSSVELKICEQCGKQFTRPANSSIRFCNKDSHLEAIAQKNTEKVEAQVSQLRRAWGIQ